MTALGSQSRRGYRLSVRKEKTDDRVGFTEQTRVQVMSFFYCEDSDNTRPTRPCQSIIFLT